MATGDADGTAPAALAYLRGRYLDLPAGRLLGPRLGAAIIWAAGPQALGLPGPLEIDLILSTGEWERVAARGAPAHLDQTDPGAAPPVRVRIRDAKWLRARLDEPEGLWRYGHATLAQDPQGMGALALRSAGDAFATKLAGQVARAYRELREGFEQADRALDPLGRSILIGRAVGAAVRLPLLARGEPWPPPTLGAWHLTQLVPEGETIVALAAQAATGRQVDAAAWARLRRLLDELLDAAGYGESVVRAYRASA